MKLDVPAGRAARVTPCGTGSPPRARYLPIAEHGLIGDLHTVALVGTDGTIDWYCCPRFDSPSVFAAILDADQGPPVTYRAEVSGRALKQMHRLPGPAFDSLIEAVVEVTDYPDDPLRTFPTSDPYVRRVEFGDAGLITYLINDGARVVIILDITWAG